MNTAADNTATDNTQNLVFNEEDRVTVYTDGSCIGNPGPGGYAAIFKSGGRRKKIAGGEPRTTNNRMELMAVIVALEFFKFALPITIFTDSQYVIQGIDLWIDDWKRNGWMRSKGKPVKNKDLWMRLDAACQRHRVKCEWVRSHSGDAGNNRADALARAEAEKMQGLVIHEGQSAADFGFD